MGNLIETLIYLLAIMGIILTSISFFEIFNYKNYPSYRLFNKNSMKNKRVEIVINIENMKEEEEEELIDTLLNGEYTNLEDIVDCVRIEKDTWFDINYTFIVKY